jgi:hypothetical protein
MTDDKYLQYSMNPSSPDNSLTLEDAHSPKTPRIAHQWNYWYAKLAEFYRKHGHCNVKQGNSPERQLGGWLARQRFLFREGNLTQQRAKKLRDMGVDFAIQRTPAPLGQTPTKSHKRITPDDDDFFFTDAANAKRKDNSYYYGDDSDYADSSSEVEIMDEDYDPQDSNWGAHKRESLQHNPHPTPKYPVHAPQIWEERFKQLCLFKDIYGHCMVPARFPENRSLGYWVKHIRSYYNEGRLPEDWVARLNTLGFVWRVKGTHHSNRSSMMKTQSPPQSSSDSDDSEDYLAAEQLALLSELSAAAARRESLFVLV